jgi:hypothetical protein
MSEPSFWDKINPFRNVADDAGQTGQAGQSALDAYAKFANGLGGPAPAAPMNGAAQSPGMGLLGGLGMLTGGFNFAQGVGEYQDGKKGQGVYDMVSGGAGFGQGLSSLLTPFVSATSKIGSALGPIGGALGTLTGGLQMGKGLYEATSDGGNGADAAFDLLQGGANTTAGIATMAGAAPVAAVAASGALGMTIGNQMAKFADSDATKTGAWGQDDSGKNQSAMDWGSNWGTWVDKHIGDKNPANPSILGGLAAGAGGIVGGIGGTAQGLWNMVF